MFEACAYVDFCFVLDLNMLCLLQVFNASDGNVYVDFGETFWNCRN